MKSISDTVKQYYLQMGPMIDPGRHRPYLNQLPNDLRDLCRLVQNCCIHAFWAENYGFSIPADRQAELQIRDNASRLDRVLQMDQAPITEQRESGQKIISNCRHFACLMVMFLRLRGIPARARCGFAAYFIPGTYEDHWVCEYWSEIEQRWILVDPQLDALQCKALKLNFDPIDLPRDQFINGGAAWLLSRNGHLDPDLFGIFDMRGLGFIRGNLIRDLAALNHMEMLPWDCWGMILHQSIDDANELSQLDHAATILADPNPELNDIQNTYQANPGFKIGHQILSFVDGQMNPVTIQS